MMVLMSNCDQLMFGFTVAPLPVGLRVAVAVMPSCSWGGPPDDEGIGGAQEDAPRTVADPQDGGRANPLWKERQRGRWENTRVRRPEEGQAGVPDRRQESLKRGAYAHNIR